jgi:tRNA(Ile)-lysidine synthase
MGSSKSSDGLSAATHEALIRLGVTPASKLLVAVSGGPDSLALAHALVSLRDHGAFKELAIGHINHQLREAANKDEALLRSYAEKWNVALHVRLVDTNSIAKSSKKGIEETARKLRYDYFNELIEEYGYEFVVTAHTANDQAETVLMNAVRGAGVRGLAGIPSKRKLNFTPPLEGGEEFAQRIRGVVIRPWLDVTRAEIEAYLAENHLEGAHDESNDELTFTRNRVRHVVMPALEQAFPDRSPVHALSSLARRMSELSSFLVALTEEKLGMLVFADNSISLEGLKQLRGQQLHAILEAWLARAGHRYRLTERELLKTSQFLHSKDKHVELRNGVVLRKHEKFVVVESR